jgi:hypothetical protein
MLLNFFLWGYVKDIVYMTSVTFDELKLRIVAATETVTPQMLENTWRETAYRLDGLVVRVPGYRSKGPGFDSRRYQIF